MVAWMDRNAWGLESEALGAGAVRIVGLAQRRGAAEGFCGTQFSVQASRARTDRTAAGASIQKEGSAKAWGGEGSFEPTPGATRRGVEATPACRARLGASRQRGGAASSILCRSLPLF